MTSELKLSRRSVLFGAGAVALSAALLPRDVREVWYHRGVPVLVERLSDRVNMTFMLGGVSFGMGYMTAGPAHMGANTRIAVRRTIDRAPIYVVRSREYAHVG